MMIKMIYCSNFKDFFHLMNMFIGQGTEVTMKKRRFSPTKMFSVLKKNVMNSSTTNNY